MAVSNINNTDTTTTTIDLKRKAVDDNDTSSKTTSGGRSPTKKKRAASSDCVPLGTATATAAAAAMVDANAKVAADGTPTIAVATTTAAAAAAAAATATATAPTAPTAATTARMKKTATISNKERWDRMFDQLKQYREKHGTCNVGLDYGKLGQWVKNQRYRYQTNIIRPVQMEALISLGFNWRLQHHAKPRNRVNTSLNDEKFVKMVDRFVHYSKETGNQWIPTKYKDTRLVHWGVNVRNQKRAGKLSDDRIAALEKVGFVWEKQNH